MVAVTGNSSSRLFASDTPKQSYWQASVVVVVVVVVVIVVVVECVCVCVCVLFSLN